MVSSPVAALRAGLFCASVFFLTACDDGGGGKSPAAAASRVEHSALPPGDATCPNGGILVETGFDLDKDGVLDENEIVDSEKVCNGAPGAAGGDGSDGLTALVSVTALSAGGLCPAGGFQVDAGLDDDDDNVLDAGEVDHSSWVCNGLDGLDGDDGSDGADGLDGYTTLMNVSAQGASGTCPAGGQRIDIGLDLDRDGTLDTGEIAKWELVCNGSDGEAGSAGEDGYSTLANVDVEAPGSNCGTGGQKLETGLDLDRDNALDAGEVQSVRYVCNGAAGSAGLSSLVAIGDEAAGANCAAGGQQIDSGLDDDRDGTLDAGEIDSTSYVCNGADGSDGEDGFNSLVKITAEPAGINCAAGGSRIDSGLDDDRDNVLDAGEIDSTSYVCSTSFPTLMVSEPHPELCLHGATVLKTGLDLDLDSTLDDAEVSSSTTICQNNSSPGMTAQFGTSANLPAFGSLAYDSVLRRYTIEAYDLGGTFAFLGVDPNGDPVGFLTGTLPSGFSADSEPVPEEEGGGLLGEVTFGAGLGEGTHVLTPGFSDTEASVQRTIDLTLHAPVWSALALPATEGTDSHMSVAVSFAEPLLVDSHVHWGMSNQAQKCDIDGENCEDMMELTIESVYNPETGFFEDVVTFAPRDVLLPAGTTSFLVRRPLGNDEYWGIFQQEYALDLVKAGTASSPEPFPGLAGEFIVIDNDPAPTVGFVDAVSTVASGESIFILLTSTQGYTPVRLIVSGDGTNGEDFEVGTSFRTEIVMPPDISSFNLFFDALLNESLTGNLIITLTIDTSTGLQAGTNASHTVTVAPPPPRLVRFNTDTASVSRYYYEHCATVYLSRANFISDVTLTFGLGGTALPGTDYVMPDPAELVIPAGELQGEFCVEFAFTENAGDVTLILDIDSADGAGIGEPASQTVTLEGGELPSVSFAAATDNTLELPTQQQTCTTLELTFPRPEQVTVRVDVASTGIRDVDYFFNDSGDWVDDDTREYRIEGEHLSQDVCISRNAVGNENPTGEAHDVTLTIVSVDMGLAIGSTPAITFGIVVPYGDRDLVPVAPGDDGNTSAVAFVVRGDRSLTAVGMSNNSSTGSWQPAIRRLLPDGTVDWEAFPVAPGSLQIVNAVIDKDGGAGLVYFDYSEEGLPYHLVAVDGDGVLLYNMVVPAGQIVAISGGAAVVRGNSDSALRFYSPAGALVATRTIEDDGVTPGCDPSYLKVDAQPDVAGSGFYVRRETTSGACNIDTDGDSLFSRVAIYKYSAAGVQAWARDDAEEVAVTWDFPSFSVTTLWGQDAAGNLYLADPQSLVKYSGTGTALWAQEYSCPSCSVLYWSISALDVSPNGNVARAVMDADNVTCCGTVYYDMRVEAFDTDGVPLWNYGVDNNPSIYVGWMRIRNDGVATAYWYEGGYEFIRRHDDEGTSTVDGVPPYGTPYLLDDGSLLFNDGYAARNYDADLNLL